MFRRRRIERAHGFAAESNEHASSPRSVERVRLVAMRRIERDASSRRTEIDETLMGIRATK
jgi:hypothetical protein